MKRALFVALSGLLATAAVGCGKKEAPAPPPPDVKAATVLQKDVPIYVEAIGQTRGSTEIEVRARVEGLQSVDFKEGNPVKKGQLLYTIDPRTLQATLAQAKGALAEADAQLARAKQDVVRYEPLVAKNAISRQEYDTAVVVQRAAEAGVEAAKATVDRAQIDLGYTRVTAPEDGLVGKTEVYPGTLVGRGQSDLLTHISQIATIHVRFTVPERDYLYYARRTQERGGKSAGGALALRAGPERRVGAPEKGHDRVRGPQHRRGHRNDHDGSGVPRPRRDRATGPVRAGARGGGHQERRHSGAATRRLRAAGHLQRRGRGRRRHDRAAHGEARAADRHALGDRLGPEGRRARRGRGHAEGADGGQGEA